MTIRTAEAEWNGPLAPGSRQMRLGSEAYEGPYDFRSRMGDGKGANPEELLGAAPAGRFLDGAGVCADEGRLSCPAYSYEASYEKRADGPFTDRASTRKHGSRTLATPAFEEYDARESFPVSRALSGVDIHLRAKFP